MMHTVPTVPIGPHALVSLSFETTNIIRLDKPTASVFEIGSTIVQNVIDIAIVDMDMLHLLIIIPTIIIDDDDELEVDLEVEVELAVVVDIDTDVNIAVGSYFETMCINGTPPIIDNDDDASDVEYYEPVDVNDYALALIPSAAAITDDDRPVNRRHHHCSSLTNRPSFFTLTNRPLQLQLQLRLMMIQPI
jgi:hypothetical protein